METQQEQGQEQEQGQDLRRQMRLSTYEGFRDSFPIGEDGRDDARVGTLWRSADRWREHLREQLAEIEADPELSDEGKQARIQSAYDRIGPRIEAQSKQAKEKAAKIAEAAVRRSIPGVANTQVDSDPAAIGNVMLEAQEIRERIARIREQTPKGMNAPQRVLDMLREEYAGAIQTGGLAGATTCAAVLRAAKVLGISSEDVYGHLREEKHLSALEEARRYSRAAETIPTRVPSLDRGVVTQNHWRKGGSPRFTIPKGGAIGSGRGKRKPSWK